MPQDKGKTNLNIKLRAELNVPETENPIRFELSTVGGEHSLFQGKNHF